MGRRSGTRRGLELGLSFIVAVQVFWVQPPQAAGVTPAPSPQEQPSEPPEPTEPPSEPEPSEPPSEPEPSAPPIPPESSAPAQPQETADESAERSELVDERTVDSRTFLNADGTYTTEIYANPIHYQAETRGEWLPIEVGFEAVEGRANEAASTKAPVGVTVRPANADDGFIEYRQGEHVVSFALSPGIDASGNARPVGAAVPILDGEVADYAEVFPGVGIRVIAGVSGAKTFLVLNEPPAQTSFALSVTAPGLNLALAEDGGIDFTDDTGVVVGRMPPPYAVDSSASEERGGGEFSDAVTLTLAGTAGAEIITISVDPAYLKTATYPVYVDPSWQNIVVNGSNGYDAFVSQHYPNTTFGDYVRPDYPYYHEMWLGRDPTNSNNVNHAFMKFDISALLGYSGLYTIDSATLQVVPYHQYYDAPTSTRTWVNRVWSANWYPATLTWNNRPASYALTDALLIEWQWGSFDVTSAVQGWVAGSFPNYGFVLHENGNDGTYWKRLLSTEHGSNMPKLVINFHTPEVSVVAPSGSAWTASRSLSWSYADPGGHAQSHFEVQVSTDPNFGSLLSTSGQVASAGTAWSIPAGVTLTNGTTYYWRARARDGTSWSAWTAAAAFRWDAASPTFTSVAVGGAVTAADPNFYDLGNGTFTVAIRGSDPNSGIKLTYLRLYNATDEMRVYHDWNVGGTNCTEYDTSVQVDAVSCAETYNSAGTREVTFTVTGLNQNASFNVQWFFYDNVNNSLGWTDSGKILHFDATAPTGNFTAPASGATVSGVATLTGTASDGNFTQYELHYGAGASPTVWNAIGSNPRSTPVTAGTLGTWDTSALTTGTYSIRLRVYDKARVSTGFTEVTRTVTVNNDLPTALITEPTGETLEDGIVGVVGTASATANFANYTLHYGIGCSPTGWISIGTNPRTTQVTDGMLGTWDTAGLAGPHTIRLVVNRSDGPTSTDTVCVTLGSSLGLQRQHSLESWDLGAGDALSVNVATGNLVVSHPIVTLPMRGDTMSLGLTYNSLGVDDVGLGSGWQLNVQRRLLMHPNGAVTFVDGDGSRHLFTDPVTVSGVTTYTRPASLYATLVRDAALPDEFRLSFRDGRIDTFDDAGASARLTRSADRHDNAITLTYGTGNQVAQITDPAGRVVDFTWDGSNRLTAISDWAYIDTNGVVQETASGTRRTYRFFYDGGRLAGWSDALNTTGSCAVGGSHLTCLTYAAGALTAVGKTQTVTTFNAGVLGTTTRPITTTVTYAGGRIASVRDAEQEALAGPATAFTWDGGEEVVVDRPTTTTTYGLVAADDPYARVASIWRHLAPGTLIERRTVWAAAFPIEPASVTDNATALQSTPARTVSYSYESGSLGLLARVVEPLTASTNRWTDYTYNASNDLTQTIVSQDGSPTLRTVTRYCYDVTCALTGTGPTLLQQIDNYVSGGPQNNDTNVAAEFTYDAYGQITRSTRHNRDATGAVLDDREDRFTYDANGNLSADIANYADGAVTSPGDDVTPNSTNLARTDLTTTYTYDTAGNRVSSADPRRAVEAARGTTLAADDFVTRWSYDALNQRLNERTPTTPGLIGTQRTSTSSYDEIGQVRTATDFGALLAASEFDRAGRSLRTFERPDGGSTAVTSQATYDADSKPLTSKDRRQVADATLGSTISGYDALGRQTSMTEAAGTAVEALTTIALDALDRRTSLEVGVGSPSSLRTTYAYDLGGRTTQTDDGFTCATEAFDYRDLRTLSTSGLAGGTCVTDDDTRTVTHSHDELGRLTRSEVTAGADLGDRTLDDAYDAVGNRLTAGARVAGVTRATSFVLNGLDQGTSEAPPDGSTAKASYDPSGNTADRCYWKPGVAVGACQPVGSSPWSDPPTQATTTAYDARNERISLVDAAAGSTTTYDPEHNYAPAAVYRATAGVREQQTLYAYDARHRLVGISFQNCAVDASHACTDTPVSNGLDTYAYDDADNRTDVLETNGASTLEREYCYDARNQLVASGGPGRPCASDPLEVFTFDDAGNRLSSETQASEETFAYDASGRLCDAETGSGATCTGGNVAHDSAGRIQSWAGWTLAYDAKARLTSACKSPTCAPGFDRVEFTYEGEGERTNIVATSAAGQVTTTEFRYQNGAVVEERVNGTVARQLVTDDSGAISKLIVPAGQPDAGTYLVNWNGHGDALNLLRVNADGSTTVANSFTYDTWGRPTTATHNGIGDLGFRYLYVGQFNVQWDDQFGLGLHYMHARHYSPALGRFIEADPTAQEENPYTYVLNSPVSAIDPSGTIAWCAIPFIGWAVCATGVRLAVWAGSAVVSWVGSMIIRAGPAATTFANRAPQTISVVRDNFGRVSSAAATITNATVRTGTAASHAARSWCCNGSSIYEAGHLIARVLGGPGGLRAGNIVAMLNKLNRGPYKALELQLLRWAEAGNRVDVWVQPIYQNTATQVPSQINYWFRLNGGPWTLRIFSQ